jgi:NADH:ubiquinone oxidoreductase subunit C
MNLKEIDLALRKLCSPDGVEIQERPVSEVFVTLPPAYIRRATQVLLDHDVHHLSMITGQDTGEEIQLLYHFWDSGGLTVRTLLSRHDAHIPSLTDLVPGAAFYEREIAEMLGVTFDGHPSVGPLFLPDDWEGSPPLRAKESDP